MPSDEDNRLEEEQALAAERAAFERRQKALAAVRAQFLPYGNGSPTMESMRELDEADEQWRKAKAVMERIAMEIRTGRRR